MTVRRIATLLASLVLAATIAVPASAQTTTSSISGKVTADNGSPVPQANVMAVHVPTGARFGTQTNEQGGYLISNARTGGPYTITVKRIGFQSVSHDNVYLTLGSRARQDFKISEVATSLGAVAVTADRDEVAANANATTSVGRAQVENLPTLSRSLQDMTRLTPSGNANSFGGANFRYNNMTVDGASANYVSPFSNSYGGVAGTGPSGTPGAAAKSQPISLDAIEQVRVAIAPFDVTLGNFTGASINAVTRSGSNNLDGSAYLFGRNQSLTGKSADDAHTSIAAYHDYQFGTRVGGPISRDKAFYFLNAEVARRHEPLWLRTR